MRGDNDKLWIIVLVAFDDAEIEPSVLKEQIESWEDPKLAAFLRGGELVAVIDGNDETFAEFERAALEKRCLR